MTVASDRMAVIDSGSSLRGSAMQIFHKRELINHAVYSSSPKELTRYILRGFHDDLWREGWYTDLTAVNIYWFETEQSAHQFLGDHISRTGNKHPLEVLIMQWVGKCVIVDISAYARPAETDIRVFGDLGQESTQ